MNVVMKQMTNYYASALKQNAPRCDSYAARRVCILVAHVLD